MARVRSTRTYTGRVIHMRIMMRNVALQTMMKNSRRMGASAAAKTGRDVGERQRGCERWAYAHKTKN